MHRTIVSFTALLVALAVAVPGVAQEPADCESVEELRREVRELRKLVEELTRRIDAMEYQRLPRAADARPAPAAPRVVPDWSEPANSKLRFPFNIERGSAAPIPQPRIQLEPRRYENFDRAPRSPR